MPRHVVQEARRKKLERMGEEILDLWQQLDIGKDEQVPLVWGCSACISEYAVVRSTKRHSNGAFVVKLCFELYQ